MPNSCSSLIEIENNPFNQVEEKSPDLILDVIEEDVAYRPVTRQSASKPRVSAIVPARTATRNSFIQYTCDASTDLEKSPQQDPNEGRGKNVLNSIFSHSGM